MINRSNEKFIFCDILGKSESIWDVRAHSGLLDNNATGDIACDSYHKLHEDIRILSEMKVTLRLLCYTDYYIISLGLYVGMLSH